MDGARLILNARYFHIAQTGEKATKYAFVAEAAAGLVNYIATRESVIYNYDEHYKEVSATEAQREAINQFLRYPLTLSFRANSKPTTKTAAPQTPAL